VQMSLRNRVAQTGLAGAIGRAAVAPRTSHNFLGLGLDVAGKRNYDAALVRPPPLPSNRRITVETRFSARLTSDIIESKIASGVPFNVKR
jgi:hypothetical protein